MQFQEELYDFNELVKILAPTKIVTGDRDRVGQVITNFISNAIKYSPHTKEIIITTLAKKDTVTLSVQDYGQGIPKEKQKKVFDRFFRVSGKNQNTFAGLGLGLFIASEIIKRHNGRIWVESERNEGSTFCFTVPIKNSRALLQQRKTLVEKGINHA